MKIAYCSPLNPVKSGISDYSEEILVYIKESASIDLFIDQKSVTSLLIKENFDIYEIEKLDEFHSNYDLIIYHMGNNYGYHGKIYDYALKYPGVVVLHDFCLQNFFLGKYYPEKIENYLDMLEENYGTGVKVEGRMSINGKRKPLWETDEALLYPLNHEIVNSSKMILVHSKFAEEKIMNSPLNRGLVDYLPFPSEKPESISREKIKRLRKKFNISNDKIVLSSFGFVSRAKRIDKILEALDVLKKEGIDKFEFLIVGEVIDSEIDIKSLIEQKNLSEEVKIIGFTDLEVFKEYIQLSDICLNLRFPTMGETSASLFRILGYGKPVILSDCGSFSDIPQNISRHISTGENEVSDLTREIRMLLLDDDLRETMSHEAIKHIRRNHTIELTADTYLRCFRQTLTLEALEYSIQKYTNVKNTLCVEADKYTSYEEAIDDFFGD